MQLDRILEALLWVPNYCLNVWFPPLLISEHWQLNNPLSPNTVGWRWRVHQKTAIGVERTAAQWGCASHVGERHTGSKCAVEAITK